MSPMNNGHCWKDVLRETVALLLEKGETAVAARLEKCELEARFCARASGCDAYTIVLVTEDEADADFLYDRCELIREALNDVLPAKGCLCTDLLLRLPAPGGPEHLLAGLRALCAAVERTGRQPPSGRNGAGQS